MPQKRRSGISGIGGSRISQTDVIGLWLRGLRVQSPSLTPDSGNTSEVGETAKARLSRELRLFQASRRPDVGRLEVALVEFLAVTP